jgi:hypothetical protein
MHHIKSINITISLSWLELGSFNVESRSIFHVSLHNLEDSSGEVLHVSAFLTTCVVFEMTKFKVRGGDVPC